jgi:hypothetical protein
VTYVSTLTICKIIIFHEMFKHTAKETSTAIQVVRLEEVTVTSRHEVSVSCTLRTKAARDVSHLHGPGVKIFIQYLYSRVKNT